MINYDSIISAFDGKPTLLQWLKLVKKALDESVLKDITVSQDGASAVFTFNFEDGTSISTPAVTLPKGETGAKGDKGDKGEQGVSVTGVDEVGNAVVGSQTLTTLRFNFSNGTNNEVVVHAENGKSGGKLYQHLFIFEETDNDAHFTIFQVLSYRSTPYGEVELYNYLMAHKTTVVGYKYKSLTYSNPVSGYQLFNELELTRSGEYLYSINKVCYYELNADGSVKRNELLNPRFVRDEVVEL